MMDRLSAAIDQLRVDVARVEMWAMAVQTFSKPIPDYQADQFRLSSNRPDQNNPRKHER